MTIYPFDYVNGVIGILALIISFYVALRIALTSFKYRDKNFILVGITGFIMSEPWWYSISAFITEAAFGFRIPGELGNLYGIPFQPIGIFTWLFAFTELVYKKQQKIILVLFSVYSIIFEIVFFIVFMNDPSLNGTFYGIHSGIIPTGFMFSFLIIILVSGILFARESIKADDPEIKMKGRLIQFAIISYCIAAVLDAGVIMFRFTPFLLISNRIVLILSAVAFYGGFLLPDWMKKILLK